MQGIDTPAGRGAARAWSRIPWIWVLASPCHAQSDSANATPDGTPDSAMWVATLFSMILVPLLLWGVRRLLVRRIQQQMMSASAEQPADGAESRGEEAAAAPGFELHEANLAEIGGGESRRQREHEALQLFRRVCLVDLAAALLYVALPATFALFEPNEVTAAALGLAVAIAGFTAVRYWLHRQQFRAFDLSRSRQRQRTYQRLGWVWRGVLVLVTIASGATASNLVYVPDILRAVFGPRMRTWLSIVIPIGAGVAGIVAAIEGSDGLTRMAGIGLLLASIAHAVLFARLGWRWRAEPGLRLLILRVFNIDTTSSFLFSGLMKYWRFFGNHFTVVDPALVRQGYSNSDWSTAFILVGAWGLLMIFMLGITRTLGEPHTWPWALALAALPSLAVAGGVLLIGRYRIDARFTRNRDQLVKRLESLVHRPRHFDLSFRHARALCHDNTWFPAVVEFARRSNAVLMDLRGYSPERRGCQREVDFLFDSVPLRRLLFLVDVATDETAVREMLLGRWAVLNHSSPNLALRAPVIQLYLSRDNDERDMQAILDRLLEIADAPQAG
jgi:hypothetical protein